MDLLIETINGMDIGWKADTCKLQKHHASYGSHCDLNEDDLLLQVEDDIKVKKDEKSKESSKDGEKPKEKPKVFGEGPEFAKVLEQA